MTIGDAGDDFAEQVLRTSMDLAKDILRYIDGLDMPHKSWADKYEIAREDASRVAEVFITYWKLPSSRSLVSLVTEKFFH